MQVDSLPSEPPGRRDFIKSIENQRDDGVRWQSTMAGFGNTGQELMNADSLTMTEKAKKWHLPGSPQKAAESSFSPVRILSDVSPTEL